MKNIQLLLKNISSFEFVFVLFLFSGQYKHAHPVFKIWDPTFFLSLILILWGTALFYRRKVKVSCRWEIAAILLLGGWMIASYWWSPQTQAGLSKIVVFWLYTLPAFLMGGCLIGADRKRLERFLNLCLGFAVFVLLVAVQTLVANEFRIVSVLGNNYLVAGQTLGVGFLIAYFKGYHVFASQENSGMHVLCRLLQKKIIIALLMGVVTIWAVLYLGGRGPLIAMGGSVLFMSLLLIFTNREGLGDMVRYGGLMCLLGGSLIIIVDYLAASPEVQHTLTRLQDVIVNPAQDGPVQERLSYYKSALELFFENPFRGGGIGGWAVFHGIAKPEIHPHNIFLEIAAELGFVGLVLMLSLVGSSFMRLKKGIGRAASTKAIHITVMGGVFLFSLLNALKTGDINDNILLFYSMGLIIGND